MTHRLVRNPASLVLAALLLFPASAALAERPAAVSGTEAPAKIGIPNARMPVEGVLTGGQPTAEHLRAAAAAGYATVVNLRGDAEMASDELAGFDERAIVEELGMEYHSIPISGGDDLSEAKARALSKLLADPEARPMLVHCGSGNRVGALFALEAFLVDREDPEKALELGVAAGLTRLEPTVREKLGLPAAAPSDP
ncbi:MAG: sulfur transferase domain-containing protein [Holophagales bacterium]|nr:sulfur transferase domain-containing protein [Holophagales bacterium]